MNPKSTSAAESMLARTGRRIAVSDSFICENFPRKVNGPDRPQRNGTCPTLVPPSSASTSKENAENRHWPVPFLFELGDRRYAETIKARKGRPKRHILTVVRAAGAVG